MTREEDDGEENAGKENAGDVPHPTVIARREVPWQSIGVAGSPGWIATGLWPSR